MNANKRVTIGLVGLTGYGGEIRKLLEEEDAHEHGRTRLAAVFAPDAAQHVDTFNRLRGNGTTICDSYDDLLAAGVEAVWLPVPIDLHRPMAERALAAGKAVMLEKPVAGCIDDHDAIAGAADAAGLPVAVGFQDVYRPTTLPLKRRLLAGEFGVPKQAVVWGLWPRPDAYYARSSWAGRLSRDGAWVLDSPLSNAMAHYVNLGLFLLGPADDEAATITRLSGETLRGRPTIENADTFSLRISLANGCDTVVLLTHATDQQEHPSLAIDTNRGTIDLDFHGRATFTPAGGTPRVLDEAEAHRPAMARRFAKLVRGELDDGVGPATLATSRPHSVLVSAAAEALPVVPVDAKHDGDGPCVIPGLADAMRRAAAARKTLGELGDSGLPLQTRSIDGLHAYAHFAGPA